MTDREPTKLGRADAAIAAIIVLLVLTGVMLASLFSRTPPHPPLVIDPFALAPFLGASLAVGAAALHLVRQGARHGAAIGILFAMTALVSFGPQKYLAPNFSQIWPTVVTAQVAVIALVAWSVAVLWRRSSTSSLEGKTYRPLIKADERRSKVPPS